jgi:hypothetical protein
MALDEPTTLTLLPYGKKSQNPFKLFSKYYKIIYPKINLNYFLIITNYIPKSI